jgi:hypothetical protein
MKEPIQDIHVDYIGEKTADFPEPLKNAPEIFRIAFAEARYMVNWMEQKNTHTFYCSDCEYGEYREGNFLDVVQDTSNFSQPYKQGVMILARQSYSPVVSLVGLPFMVETLKYLPAAGENTREHIPEDVNVLPSDDDVRGTPGVAGGGRDDKGAGYYK